MVAGIYETLLDELSEILKIKELKPDANNSCLIKLENGCEVQIEPDEQLERLLIGANIAQLTPGGFRTSVFKEALKYNGLPPPKFGIFAWSQKADQLVLFSYKPIKDLNGEKLADILIPFTATVIKWRETINSGQVPVVQFQNATSGGSLGGGMFGLRP